MDDDTDRPAGWTIVSIADDGSVLCQSPRGHRRRYWFQAAEICILQAKSERLRALLEPCRPDTDAQTDPSYPKTVNDVLHLLSCYWSDFLPDDVELGDEIYAAWERQARPVIERMLGRK